MPNMPRPWYNRGLMIFAHHNTIPSQKTVKEAGNAL